jgi:hypothetical protein
MSQSASSPKVGGVELGDVEKKSVEITEKLDHLTMHSSHQPTTLLSQPRSAASVVPATTVPTTYSTHVPSQWTSEYAKFASKYGAVAACKFWAFDRSAMPSGKPAGFQTEWTNGAPKTLAAVQGLSTVQKMAIEISEKHKVKIPCCCCLPPAFTPGAAAAVQNEMTTGGFAAAAASATGHAVQLHTEWLNDNQSTATHHFILLLIPQAAYGQQ